MNWVRALCRAASASGFVQLAGRCFLFDPQFDGGVAGVSCSERRKEIKRRRHRRKKLDQCKRKLGNASVSETAHIANKIRNLTPGGQIVIDRLGLEER
jgi:hypothetical protein